MTDVAEPDDAHARELALGFDAAAVAVGHRVAQATVAHGLDVRWDASAGARIEVVGLDWRRPLPT